MNGVEYPCKVEDLVDEGEIGRGRFGSVHRMKHSPSGKRTGRVLHKIDKTVPFLYCYE